MNATPIGALAAAQLRERVERRRDLLTILYRMEPGDNVLVPMAAFGGETTKAMNLWGNDRERLIDRHPELLGGRVYRSTRCGESILIRRTV